MAEYERDWEIYGQLLTYACNAQVNRSTNLSPFSLDLSPPWTYHFRLSHGLRAEALATTFTNAQKDRVLQSLATMGQDEDKRMKFIAATI